jgi:hypothetical protein
MCKNYFLVAATKYRFKRLAFAATIIRPGYLPDSNVAQLISMSAFLHSLDPMQTLDKSRFLVTHHLDSCL